MAVTSRLAVVLERIRDTIATADGDGTTYTHNLCDEPDSVQYGTWDGGPPATQDGCVYLVDVTVDSEKGGAAGSGRSLRSYQKTVSVGFIGVVSDPTGESSESALIRAALLLNDIDVALKTNRELTVSGGTPEKAIDNMDVVDESLGHTGPGGQPGFAYCTGAIEVVYALDETAGV